jgi:hypothetical protein
LHKFAFANVLGFFFLIPNSNIRKLPKRHLIHRLIGGAIFDENTMNNFSSASLVETRAKLI